jgi:hypothetical protein
VLVRAARAALDRAQRRQRRLRRRGPVAAVAAAGTTRPLPRRAARGRGQVDVDAAGAPHAPLAEP